MIVVYALHCLVLTNAREGMILLTKKWYSVLAHILNFRLFVV